MGLYPRRMNGMVSVTEFEFEGIWQRLPLNRWLGNSELRLDVPPWKDEWSQEHKTAASPLSRGGRKTR